MKTCMGKGKDRRTRSCSNSGQYLQKQHLNLTPSVPLSADQYPYVLVKRWTASDNPEYQQWLKSPHYTRIIACFTIFYHQIVTLVTSTNSSLAGSGAGKRFFSSVLSHLCSELFLTQLQLTECVTMETTLFSPDSSCSDYWVANAESLSCPDNQNRFKCIWWANDLKNSRNLMVAETKWCVSSSPSKGRGKGFIFSLATISCLKQ